MKPQIVVDSNFAGYHNINTEATTERLDKARSYQDLSTIVIIPCLDYIPSKVVQNWLMMMPPMNQKFIRMFAMGMEVGAAYSETIDFILSNPELGKWKYILTIEHDNMPPPDGLLKLYENMDKYDAIGGLYFTKGETGQPMCYGKTDVFPVNFIPFMPEPETVTPCRGVAMGFTLYKLDMFKNKDLPRPFFETRQKYTYGQGMEGYTQDLKFCENAGKLGYKFAVDSRVRVGHYDVNNDMIW